MTKGLENDRGGAAVFVLMFLFLLALVPTAMQVMSVSVKQSKHELSSSAQAENVAMAGLTDTLSWFRRQTSQPVCNNDTVNPDAAFNPQASTNDTIDAALGIVKEFPVREVQAGQTSPLWARYEVRRTAVHDVSDLRLNQARGSGLVWSVESVGYVYHGPTFDPSKALARSRASCEIRSIGMNISQGAALTISDLADLRVRSGGQIYGNTEYGVAYHRFGTPNISGNGEVTGAAGQWVDVNGPADDAGTNVGRFFGVSNYNELCSLADIRVSSVDNLPAKYPENALVCIDGNANFTAAKPLQGSGVLVIDGDLNLPSSAKTVFSGLIYARDDADIAGPALISGMLIVADQLDLDGSIDVAQLTYDPVVLDMVANQVLQYRLSRSLSLGAIARN